MSFLFINKTLRLKNLQIRTAMNGKVSVFVICVESIIYLLFYSLHDCTFNFILFVRNVLSYHNWFFSQFQQGVYIPFDFKHYITAYKLISEENEIFPIMMKYFSVFYCVKITNKLRQMILWNLDIFNSIQIPHCHLQQENHQ